MQSFRERFLNAMVEPEPLGLQLVFAHAPVFDAHKIVHNLHLHPELDDTTCEFQSIAAHQELADLVSGDGPPVSALGLIQFGLHIVKVIQCDSPMPYGPIETCIIPAMMPGEIKADARAHTAHAMLYYAGSHPEALERYVALAAVAGALAIFDAIAVLNEEARTAAPALDLIPDDGEDFLQTYRTLPIPYLFGGFVKLDLGNPDKPCARTFACHRLGLPNLARHLASHAETTETFRLFTGILGYARDLGEPLQAGESLDFGGGTRYMLRAPHETEWYLDSPGTMLVLEQESEE